MGGGRYHYKELLPIIVAAAVWRKLWNHLHICFHSYNLTVAAIICKFSAKNCLAHHLICCFYFYAAFYRFQYSIEYVPGVLDTATDGLSCNNINLFSSLVPQASQTVVNTSVEELLITRIPDWRSASGFGSSRVPCQCLSSFNLANLQLCCQAIPHLLLSIWSVPSPFALRNK